MAARRTSACVNMGFGGQGTRESCGPRFRDPRWRPGRGAALGAPARRRYHPVVRQKPTAPPPINAAMPRAPSSQLRHSVTSWTPPATTPTHNAQKKSFTEEVDSLLVG